MVRSQLFEWDEKKAIVNQAKHGVRFEIATAVFFDDGRADYDVTHVDDGESRRKAVGVVDGRLVTVVYTVRGPALRIISARRSNPQEARRYADS